MASKELISALYERMSTEQNEYRRRLLSQPSEESLSCAYEYAIREDILHRLEIFDLTDDMVKALLTSDTPLADILAEWNNMKTNYVYINEIWKQLVKDVVGTKTQMIPHQETVPERCEGKSYPEIYIHSLAYAERNGEESRFYESNLLDRSCSGAIADVFWKNTDALREFRPEEVKPILEKYGEKRTAMVLAANVRHYEKKYGYYRAYRDEIREWAHSIPLPDSFYYFGRVYSGDVRSIGIRKEIILPSSYLDTFIDTFRAVTESDKQNGYQIEGQKPAAEKEVQTAQAQEQQMERSRRHRGR